jgi:hypothetical protein
VIADYIAFRGGKRVIQRILVANNGLAAVRFMRRLREWSFEYLGSEKALHFICMPTPEDIEVGARRTCAAAKRQGCHALQFPVQFLGSARRSLPCCRRCVYCVH